MDFDVAGVELQRRLQMSHSIVHPTRFDQRPSEDELRAGRRRYGSSSLFGIRKRSRGIVSQEQIPRQHRLRRCIVGRRFQLAPELYHGLVLVFCKQEVAQEIVSIGGGWKAVEEVLKFLLTLLVVACHEAKGGIAYREDEIPLVARH